MLFQLGDGDLLVAVGTEGGCGGGVEAAGLGARHVVRANAHGLLGWGDLCGCLSGCGCLAGFGAFADSLIFLLGCDRGDGLWWGLGCLRVGGYGGVNGELGDRGWFGMGGVSVVVCRAVEVCGHGLFDTERVEGHHGFLFERGGLEVVERGGRGKFGLVVCFGEENGFDDDKVMPVDLRIGYAFLFLLLFFLEFLLLLEFHPLGALLGSIEDMVFVPHVVFELLDSLLLRCKLIKALGAQKDGVLID